VKCVPCVFRKREAAQRLQFINWKWGNSVFLRPLCVRACVRVYVCFYMGVFLISLCQFASAFCQLFNRRICFVMLCYVMLCYEFNVGVLWLNVKTCGVDFA